MGSIYWCKINEQKLKHFLWNIEQHLISEVNAQLNRFTFFFQKKISLFKPDLFINNLFIHFVFLKKLVAPSGEEKKTGEQMMIKLTKNIEMRVQDVPIFVSGGHPMHQVFQVQ